jgi:Tfp pilus assembly protein PilW
MADTAQATATRSAEAAERTAAAAERMAAAAEQMAQTVRRAGGRRWWNKDQPGVDAERSG